MKKYWIFIVIIFFCYPKAYSNWKEIKLPGATNEITKIEFVDNNMGYCLEAFSGRIFITEDGGQNWSMIFNTNSADEVILDFEIFKNDLVFATANLNTFASNLKKIDIHSYETKQLSSFQTSFISSIEIIDDSRMIASGLLFWDNTLNAVIYKTLINWAEWERFFPLELGEVDFDWVSNASFLNDSMVLGIGSYGNLVEANFYTNNWKYKDIANGADLHGIEVYDENNVWVFNEEGLLICSNDGGNTWKEKSPEGNHSALAGFGFTNSNDFYLSWNKSNQGILYHTDDGGDNWDIVYENPSELFYSIFIKDDMSTFIGGKGKLLFNKLTDVDIEDNQYKIDLWPNPANTSIKFSANSFLPGTHIIIMDLMGITLKEKIIHSEVNIVEFDISKLTKGLYFVLIVDDNKIQKLKFIK